jgi:hypothetical protein
MRSFNGWMKCTRARMAQTLCRARVLTDFMTEGLRQPPENKGLARLTIQSHNAGMKYGYARDSQSP